METAKGTNLAISLELANIIKQFAKRFQIEIDAKNFANYLETHCQNALVHFITGDVQLEDIAIIIERFEDYSYQLTHKNIEVINEDYFALEDEILFFYNQLQQKHRKLEKKKGRNQIMANVSTGYGTVTIYAKELEDIAQLVYLQYLNEKKAYYYTTLTEIDDLSSILNDDNKTLNNKLTAIDRELYTDTSDTYNDCPIYAEFTLDLAGRCTFTNNINWFFTQAFNLNHLYDHSDEINQLIDKVKQRNYYVEFNFTEEEGGCDFIQEGNVIIKWNGQRQEQTVESEEYHEYDYSASNLIGFGLYDAGDVWDTAYIIDNPETFKYCLLETYDEQDLVEIAENLDLFIMFLKDNQEELDTGVYWEIKEWYEESFSIDDLDVEWSKLLETKNN